jgi:hypothetical protein
MTHLRTLLRYIDNGVAVLLGVILAELGCHASQRRE